MAITNNLKIHRTGVYLLSLLALTMVIVPLAAAALTVTTDKAEYVPGDTLVVSGTATPNSAVTIRVYSPGDTTEALDQASVDGNGAYSATNVLVWQHTDRFPYGTYRISAVDASNGDTTEITVEFAESTTATTTTDTTTTEVSTATVTRTSTRTSTLTTTSTSTRISTLTTTSTTISRTTLTSTATVTSTPAAQTVTKTSTAPAQTQTQTSTVTSEVTGEGGMSSTVTYAAIAVAVISIIGAAVLTMKQRGML